MRVSGIQRDSVCKQNQPLQNYASFQGGWSKETRKSWDVVQKQLEYMAKLSRISNHLEWQMYAVDGVRNAKNIEDLSASSELISGLTHNAIVDEKFGQAVEQLYSGGKNLSTAKKAIVRDLHEEIKKVSKITQEQDETYTRLQNETYTVWEKAKEKSDYALYKPHLEEITNYKKELISTIFGHPATYEDFMDDYMPGWTVKELDPVFAKLKEDLVPLIGKINGKIAEDPQFYKFAFLKRRVEPEVVKSFVSRLVKDIGFNPASGKISESEHPFTESLNGKYDTRFTIDKVSKNPTVDEFLTIIFSALHENGHTMVSQKMPARFQGTPIDDFDMDLHESQSRFWENLIGKSKEFWQHYLPELKKVAPQAFDGVTVDEIYKAVNMVKPTPVRLESDELTYNMHILLRYELEKEIVSNPEFDYSKLPEIWNKMTKELIGITPENDSRGILQDMHWSDGSIGYFPSYSIGNIIGPQIFNRMKVDIPDIQAKIAQGEFKPILKWLQSHLYNDGNTYGTIGTLKRVTGEELNPKYFINYATNKFSEIYDL